MYSFNDEMNNEKNSLLARNTGFDKKRLLCGVAVCLVAVVLIGLNAITLGLLIKENKVLPNETIITCQNLVLGGGIGGLYAAYNLVQYYGGKVCVIEKENRLGGRIEDYVDENGWRIGLLAIRILGFHKYMMSLANIFHIELQTNVGEWGRAFTRGSSFLRNTGYPQFDSKMCKEAFKGLNCDISIFDMLKTMVQEYIDDPSVIDETPDFVTYVSRRWGPEGLEYLKASIRYASDFKDSLSTKAMFSFYGTELKDMGFDPQRYYPVGGMSQFISNLEKGVFQKNGRIFTQEEVLKIEKDDDGYVVTTTNYVFKSKKVISTLPPVDLVKVKGEIASKITSSPQFQSIVPAELATVTAWYNRTWWQTSENFNVNISTITSTENCFNAMDIFSYPYARQQHVIRAVYDDGKCVKMWKGLYESGNKDMLRKTVNAGLQQVFPDIKVIPTPRHLVLRYVFGAWYYLHSNTKYTTDEIFRWSLDPIGDGTFSMASESYNLAGTAWCEGSLEAVAKVIEQFYDLPLNFTK